MSGILAIFNQDGRPLDRDAAASAIARIAYRGSAHRETWVSEDGMALLSAALHTASRVDVGDRQPFQAGGVTVVADALLTQRAGLIARLQTAGQPADAALTNSGLIAQAYLAWGENCLSHLDGEFCFIIWDARQKRVFAARDPLGVRDLFYAHVNGTLLIANELMAILQHPAVSGALNEATIGDFLLFGLPTRHNKMATMFRDAHRLGPGHRLTAHVPGAEISLERYWHFPTDVPMLRLAKPADYVAAFRDVLTDAVRDRVAEVERIAMLMSGGLDSTSIAAIITQLNQTGQANVALSAVSVVYDRIAPDDEAYYAHKAAAFLKIPIHFMAADTYLMTEPPIGRIEPLQDYNGPLILDMEQALAERGTLGISGNGGDEILPNTPLYRALLQHSLPQAAALYGWLWRMMGRRPAIGGVRHYVGELLRFGRQPAPEPPAYPYPTWLSPDFEARATLKDRWNVPWSVSQAPQHKTQPDIPSYVGLGTWADRTEFVMPKPYTPIDLSMPFVDLRVVRFALSVPPAPWDRRKLLLRQAMQGMLPTAVLKRPKTPAPMVGLSLVAQPSMEWIDTWQPVPELAQFVRREAIPPVYATESIERLGIDTRPFFLNEWLRAMRMELGK